MHRDVIRKCNKPGKVISEQESKKEKVQMKVEKIPTSQKAKSDLAQGVQVTIRALSVNTSNRLKGKLRSALQHCGFKPTKLPAPC